VTRAEPTDTTDTTDRTGMTGGVAVGEPMGGEQAQAY
jgi:hypothetical protein